jgi:hypothetical protein
MFTLKLLTTFVFLYGPMASVFANTDCLDSIRQVLLSSQVSSINNPVIRKSFQTENNNILNEYNEWLKDHHPEELIQNKTLQDHIIAPRLNVDGEAKIVSGMHTVEGALEFFKLRPDIIPNAPMRAQLGIEAPEICKTSECFEFSLMINLNGVMKIQLPEGAFNKRGRNATMSSALESENTYLTKTLFPASMTEEDLRASILRVMNSPTKVIERGRLSLYEGIGVDKVKTVVVFNNDLGEIVSAYPSYHDQNKEFMTLDLNRMIANMPLKIANAIEETISETTPIDSKLKKALIKKTLKGLQVGGFISEITDFNRFLDSGLIDIREDNYLEVLKRIMYVSEIRYHVEMLKVIRLPKNDVIAKRMEQKLLKIRNQMRAYLFFDSNKKVDIRKLQNVFFNKNTEINKRLLGPFYKMWLREVP